MAAPRDVYMVNYFAIDNGGYGMWQSYNGAQYQADMVTVLGLGFNTIRINVAAYNGVFNFPSPTTAQLANWADFCTRAKAVNMRLHVAQFAGTIWVGGGTWNGPNARLGSRGGHWLRKVA